MPQLPSDHFDDIDLPTEPVGLHAAASERVLNRADDVDHLGITLADIDGLVRMKVRRARDDGAQAHRDATREEVRRLQGDANAIGREHGVAVGYDVAMGRVRKRQAPSLKQAQQTIRDLLRLRGETSGAARRASTREELFSALAIVDDLLDNLFDATYDPRVPDYNEAHRESLRATGI